MSGTIISAIKILVMFCCLLSLSTYVRATEIHKWTDEKGHTHYGDKPDENVTSRKIDVHTSSSQATSKKGSSLDKQKKVLKAMEESRKEREQKLAEKRTALEEQKKHEEECKKLRNELADYERGGVVWYDLDEKGERQYLEESEIEKRKNRLRDTLKQRCNQ